MIDVVLLIGKLLFLALMYLFLFAAARTAVGLVSGAAAKDAGTWRLGLAVTRGPKELMGIVLDLSEPILIGRSPDANLVIADSFISQRHARVDPTAEGPVLKDLGSTNGTLLNDRPVSRPTVLKAADKVGLGKVELEVRGL